MSGLVAKVIVIHIVYYVLNAIFSRIKTTCSSVNFICLTLKCLRKLGGLVDVWYWTMVIISASRE